VNESMLEPPRWRGGPPICKAVRLPAFEDEAGMKKFEAMYTENSDRKVKSRWQCMACGGWHYNTEST
jgi:hypothetical protein